MLTKVPFDFAAPGTSGAAIRTYLLERSRVVNVNDPERNYHVFYQVTDGTGLVALPRMATEACCSGCDCLRAGLLSWAASFPWQVGMRTNQAARSIVC